MDLALDQAQHEARVLAVALDRFGQRHRLGQVVGTDGGVEDHRLLISFSTISSLRPRWRATEGTGRSEEHTSELQSLMRISYAVFCLKKNKDKTIIHNTI